MMTRLKGEVLKPGNVRVIAFSVVIMWAVLMIVLVFQGYPAMSYKQEESGSKTEFVLKGRK